MGFRSLILLAIAFVLWSFPRLALAQDYSLAAVRAAFAGSSVVPDVLPRLNNLFFLDIVHTMPSTGRKIHVHTGGNFTKPETNYRPVFSIRSNNPAYNKRIEDQTYVIIGIDPDAPTPHNRSVSDVVHFLGGGFRVSGTVSAGQASVLTNVTPAIHDYAPPNPPDFSEAHRYVWLLYNETRGFMSQTFVNKTTSRRNFNLTAFVEATGMRRPIGGTFYYASTNPAEVGNGTLIAPTPVPVESSAAGTSVPLPFSSAWTFFVVMAALTLSSLCLLR